MPAVSQVVEQESLEAGYIERPIPAVWAFAVSEAGRATTPKASMPRPRDRTSRRAHCGWPPRRCTNARCGHRSVTVANVIRPLSPRRTERRVLSFGCSADSSARLVPTPLSAPSSRSRAGSLPTNSSAGCSMGMPPASRSTAFSPTRPWARGSWPNTSTCFPITARGEPPPVSSAWGWWLLSRRRLPVGPNGRGRTAAPGGWGSCTPRRTASARSSFSRSWAARSRSRHDLGVRLGRLGGLVLLVGAIQRWVHAQRPRGRT